MAASLTAAFRAIARRAPSGSARDLDLESFLFSRKRNAASLTEATPAPQYRRVPFVREEMSEVLREVPDVKYYFVGDAESSSNPFKDLPMKEPVFDSVRMPRGRSRAWGFVGLRRFVLRCSASDVSACVDGAAGRSGLDGVISDCCVSTEDLRHVPGSLGRAAVFGVGKRVADCLPGQGRPCFFARSFCQRR